jgi:hypothetical protein
MPDGNSQGVRDEKLTRMKRWFSIASVILTAVVLLLYRNEVAGWLAYSFSYLAWSLNFLGRIIPPQGVWIGLLILIVYIAVGSFYGKGSGVEESHIEQEPDTGPVEAMAEWIEERRRGVYFKWRIAHLLGKVRESHMRNTSGRLLPASSDVEAYLEAGVNSSYVDYPTPTIFKKYEPTVLDIDLEPVLDYLEDQMEIHQ